MTWSLTPFPKPSTLTVRADHRSRFAAVQELMRPDEVQPILRVPTYYEAMTPFASRLADWLRGHLSTGMLRYLADGSGRDVWQSPSETLRRGGGDCEDLALLALSFLENQKIPAVLVTGTYNGFGHAWVEGQDADGGFMIEATSGGFLRGNRPWGYVPDSLIGRDFFRRAAA
jgi:transglutaminase-like putative cysteine protease